MKKVIVLLIDSMMPEALDHGFKEQKLPTIAEILKHGINNHKCLSVFPTMSASFDASFATGVNPDIHGIPGLVWYHDKERRIVNYGNTFMGVLKVGITQFINDILYNQNAIHLSNNVETIYEKLDELGYTSGVLGYQLFRGKYEHKVKIPWIVDLLIMKNFKESINGPNELILGRFVNSLARKIPGPVSIFKRGGLNDEFIINSFIEMIKLKKQPDFSLLYLPTTDQFVHKKHLQGGIEGLINVDLLLKKLIQAYGSINQALDNNIFILTGDHSQVKIDDLIDLNVLLQKFYFPKLRDKITQDHDLIICNNERMVYLYYRDQKIAKDIINELKKDNRIDIIAFKNNSWINVLNSDAKEGILFKKGSNYEDEFGDSWDIKGDIKLLDLKIANNKINYGEYPNALSMLESALGCTDTPAIIITAKPGYMFKSESSPNFKGGGSHGGLHISEMTVPFLISEKTNIPLPQKLTDMKNYVIQILEQQKS